MCSLCHAPSLHTEATYLQSCHGEVAGQLSGVHSHQPGLCSKVLYSNLHGDAHTLELFTMQPSMHITTTKAVSSFALCTCIWISRGQRDLEADAAVALNGVHDTASAAAALHTQAPTWQSLHRSWVDNSAAALLVAGCATASWEVCKWNNTPMS